jgi:hypothetical protein
MRRADNLTTFMCECLEILGASTFWSPKSLSRSVYGLLCTHTYCIAEVVYLIVNGLEEPWFGSQPLLQNLQNDCRAQPAS